MLIEHWVENQAKFLLDYRTIEEQKDEEQVKTLSPLGKTICGQIRDQKLLYTIGAK